MSERPRHHRPPRAAATLLLSLAFAAAVAVSFWAAWHPPASFYAYNIPIAVPFAAFFLDRWSHRAGPGRLVDAAVLLLALLRVLAPPLPYASGHVLFAGYATATAHGRVLRVTAGVVLLEVVGIKVFVTGGLGSMVAGLALAGVAAFLRRRLTRSGGGGAMGV